MRLNLPGSDVECMLCHNRTRCWPSVTILDRGRRKLNGWFCMKCWMYLEGEPVEL